MSGAVLVISPEGWGAHAVSKHHYARVLAEGGRPVVFADPAVPGAAGPTVVEAGDASGVRVLRGPRVAPGLRFMPAPLRRGLEARWLAQVEAAAGTRIDTVWLFENSRFFDMGFAGDRLKIYHQVDLNQDFHPLEAARTADVCLCTTDIIRERLRPAGRDVHKIHHAAAVLEDADPPPDDGSFAQDRPNALYIGNLDMPYIDVAALERLVTAHPEVLFHFVGGYGADTPLHRRCGGAPNVRFRGKVPFRAIPGLLARADVLLVAYLRARQRDQASPHKFMEYFLSGRTVVCSYTDEYKDKRHLVEMADPDAEIDGIFARVVRDLPRYNAPERVAARQAFARDHSYARQLERIARIVRDTTGREL